jgi:hypothetical protein
MKVIEFFKAGDDTHYMPVIWLSLGDQMIIISKCYNRISFQVDKPNSYKI